MAKRAFCFLLIAALTLSVSTAAAQKVYLCQRGAQTPVYTDAPGKAKVPCRLFDERGRGTLSLAPYPVPELGDRVQDLLREEARRADEAARLGESLIDEAKSLVGRYRDGVKDRVMWMLVAKRTRSYSWILEIKMEKGELLERAESSRLGAGDRKEIESILAEIPPLR